MNDFNSILARLRQGMPSDISTIEGSFSGDILMAVANELAMFYAVDIETIYGKAFVTGAEGEWLDLACQNWGISREVEESDQALRARVLNHLRTQAVSGNAAHYIEWALSYPEVLAVQVAPQNQGVGTVDVYLVPQSSLSAEKLAEIGKFIGDSMPVGARLTVQASVPKSLITTCKLYVSAATDFNMVVEKVKGVISQYFIDISTCINEVNISFPMLQARILQVPEVLDIADLNVGGKAASYKMNKREYPQLGTATFTKLV